MGSKIIFSTQLFRSNVMMSHNSSLSQETSCTSACDKGRVEKGFSPLQCITNVITYDLNLSGRKWKCWYWNFTKNCVYIFHLICLMLLVISKVLQNVRHTWRYNKTLLLYLLLFIFANRCMNNCFSAIQASSNNCEREV